MNECQLCTTSRETEWNTTLMESPNFRVLPSLGALVEGWVLLLPKDHFLSMGSLPSPLIREMNWLKNLACDLVGRIYGPVAVFEHGPGEGCRKVGCGVDHAHLHIVPVDFDLFASAACYLPNDACWQGAGLADCQEAARAGDDYIYVEQPLGEGRMIRHKQLGSQVLRRVIAARLGTPNEFDWRTYPRIENVRATIRAFAANVEGAELALDISDYAA